VSDVRVTAAASGAYVVPQFGPGTVARYRELLAASGTVAAKRPPARVRTPVNLVHVFGLP
jgi:hypothetical protein